MAEQYDTTKLGQRVNQVSTEVGGKGVAGLYRHPESGQEMATLSDPLFGEAQSNAAVQLGFVRVGDVPEGYIKHIDISTLAQSASETETVKGLSARMAQLEGVQAKNADLQKQVDDLLAEKAASAQAKAAQSASETETVDAAKPLSAQDTTELLATAVREGVDVSSVDQNDNTKLVEAIQTARDSKESENQ